MQEILLKDVAKVFGQSNSQNIVFKGVSVDSRLYQAGQLFFALPGAKVDGSQFLSDVVKKGALAAIVCEDYSGPNYGLILIRVKDPLQALQLLAKDRLEASKSRVIGVTGSVGKTTTKDFIATVLREKYRVAASPGNSNSQIGIPLTILNHTNGTEDIIVLEMGMTHKGNISKLLDIAAPECVCITAVAMVHACNFESLDEIAMAKAEILQHPSTRLAIINRDIPNFDDLIKIGNCEKLSFSFKNSSANYEIISDNPLKIRYQDEIVHLGQFPLTGKHNQSNFLVAVACAKYFGLSWKEISSAMQKLKLPELRGQFIEKEGIQFINDAYNAAPISVKAALENLPNPATSGRKIAVLADMLELGKFSEDMHREIGRYALNYVDTMFCYGKESKYIEDCWKNAKREVKWFSDRQQLARALKTYLKSGDVVLVKGSRGTEISKIIDDMETLQK